MKLYNVRGEGLSVAVIGGYKIGGPKLLRDVTEPGGTVPVKSENTLPGRKRSVSRSDCRNAGARSGGQPFAAEDVNAKMKS